MELVVHIAGNKLIVEFRSNGVAFLSLMCFFEGCEI
jgi:hypothetical protein